MKRRMNAKDLIQDAYNHNYSVAAMNANGATYDIARAILEAADDEQAPIIIQSYEPNIIYRGLSYFVKLVDHLAEDISVPYAVTLDHGHSDEVILGAAKAGFTGVMIDNLNYTLAENIKKTKRFMELVNPMGISVEAEVGAMPMAEDIDGSISKSDIGEVETFIEEAKPDLLAISVGTKHGIFEKQDCIDFNLIEKIRSMTDIPLVMHGTSGISLEDVTKIVISGMRKINFGELFRANFIKYFVELADTTDHGGHAWKVMRDVKDRLKSDMREIIRAIQAGC